MVFADLPEMGMVRDETALEDCRRSAGEQSRVCCEFGVLKGYVRSVRQCLCTLRKRIAYREETFPNAFQAPGDEGTREGGTERLSCVC